MNTRPFLIWLAGGVLQLVVVNLCASKLSAQPVASSPIEPHESQDWLSLVQQCREAGQAELADRISQWSVNRRSDRQYLFLPALQDRDLSTSPSEWEQQFFALRRRRGEALWQDAQAAMKQGDLDRAYRLLFEIAREDVTHPETRRILKLDQLDRQTAPIGKGKARQKRTRWPAGTYWRANSAHFSISSNAGQETLLRFVERMEQYYWVWQQVFVRHWATASELQRAFAGAGLDPPSRRKHQIVLFANREEFLRHLKPIEPQIEMALGVYRHQDRTTYLYHADDESLEATWVHEVTHQLLQESTAGRHEVGEASHFWMVEGAAIYMESVRWHEGYATVGGIDANRLQIARYRCLNEDFYVPLDTLCQLSKRELQTHPSIRQLYTQSAGLTHFFMDGRNGQYRSAFIATLSELYRRSKKNVPLSTRMDEAPHRIDQRYRQYLIVADQQLAELPSLARIHQLALGHTEVTGVGLQHLAGAVNVRWLDLAHLPVDDRALDNLANWTALRRLNLEGTNVTADGVRTMHRHRLLEELDLSGLSIRDATIASLGPLENLKVLWLSNTRVGKNGIRHLGRLPNLELVDVTGTLLTRSQWDELRVEMPFLQHQGFE